MKTLSKRQVEQRGLTVETASPRAAFPDPHFSTNPAKVRFFALTNTPAIEDMAPIVNSSTFEGGQNNMDELIKKLAELLGLGEDATAEQVMEALKACVTENKTLKENPEGKQPPTDEGNVVANKAVCELLGLKSGAATEDVTAAIMALKGGKVDGVDLAAEVKSLKATLAERDADEAVELALKSGKIAPAQKEWAKGYALESPKGFKAFVDKAPQAVPLDEIAGNSALALKSTELDEATMLACKQLGVSKEDVEQFGMKKEG